MTPESRKKDLLLEHKLLVAQSNKTEAALRRLAEIETELDMTAEQIASQAISDYLRQY